jgi:TonB family protein
VQIAGEPPTLIDDSPAWIPGPGPARLRCTITAQGATSACEVLEGPPRAIPALLTSVASWRFTPATCEGAPVAATTELKVPLLPRPTAAPGSDLPVRAQGTPTVDSAPPGSVIVPFHGNMTRPVFVSGRQPAYTPEARRAGVEGQVRARCTLDTDGSLHDCAIVWSMPLLDQTVLDTLTTQRYTPATADGKPVKVAYTLRFRFALR